MFDKLPKSLIYGLMFVRSMNLQCSCKLLQSIMYLWREFSIKTEIIPVVSEVKVRFYYKDKKISGIEVTDLSELLGIIEELKKSRV